MEEPLEIVVNGRSVAVLMRMPGQEKELVGGFCVSEGYVRRAEDILLIHHCGLAGPEQRIESSAGEGQEGVPESRNRVEVRVIEDALRIKASDSLPDRPNKEATEVATTNMVRLIRPGCGAADVAVMRETLPLLPAGFSVAASALVEMGRAMRGLQRVHHQVGGTHAAALFDAAGRAVSAAEDIGRHNAVDKAIGYCLLRGIPVRDKVLVTSGRASSEMAIKAIRLGIPVVATHSAPTSLAVQLAEDRGLTLVGYLRGERMNVYTHAERLRFEAG
jgi:FdhD protein